MHQKLSCPLSFGLQDVVYWARRGSNTGPLDLQSNALPTAPQTREAADGKIDLPEDFLTEFTVMPQSGRGQEGLGRKES